jgi:hypothetical protein
MTTEPTAGEVTHRCPPEGSGIMPCCGRTPFQAMDDRMTLDDALVTCGRSKVQAPEADLEKVQAPGADLAEVSARLAESDDLLRATDRQLKATMRRLTAALDGWVATLRWIAEFNCQDIDLLMQRGSDIGSTDLLDRHDVVTHFQWGRKYVPVEREAGFVHRRKEAVE